MSNKSIPIDVSNIESDNIRTFILIFEGIIWGEVYKTAFYYCEHNYKPIDKKSLVKSLIWNLYSNKGIVNNISGYIIQALKDGFLMPPEDQRVKQGTDRFREAYNILINSSDNTEFILSFTDTDLIHNDKFDNMKLLFGNDRCKCGVCKSINGFKNNSKDNFRELINKDLSRIIKNNGL